MKFNNVIQLLKWSYAKVNFCLHMLSVAANCHRCTATPRIYYSENKELCFYFQQEESSAAGNVNLLVPLLITWKNVCNELPKYLVDFNYTYTMFYLHLLTFHIKHHYEIYIWQLLNSRSLKDELWYLRGATDKLDIYEHINHHYQCANHPQLYFDILK